MSMTASLHPVTPAHVPPRAIGPWATSRLGQAFGRMVVFLLAGGAAVILVWAALHTGQPGAGPRTANARPVTTLSSEQLLSELRTQQGLATSPAAGKVQPAPVTAVPVPLAQP